MSFSKTDKLLKASKEGDIKSVQSLLAKKKIDINCKDFLTKNIHDIQYLFFIIFTFFIIFGI